MIYVMSDIHGCFEAYQKMLKKIAFSEGDTLYILGDVVDRGPQGMRVLLDIAERENVILLRGNHDEQAYVLLQALKRLEQPGVEKALAEAYEIWLSDGGMETLKEFLLLSSEQQGRVFKVLGDSLFSKEICINTKCYLLAHTVPEADVVCDFENWGIEEFLMGEPDYEEVYFEDKYIVTGHTPTGFIDEKSVGKIWKGNRHIAIDCGAVFGYGLGCLCLDSMEEFYVR